MTAAPAIVRTPRQAWLAERRNFIGASDVPAILGIDTRKGPLAIYCEKVSDKVAPEEDVRRWLAFGRRVEGAIADWFSDETGRDAIDLGAYEIQRHPDVKCLGATLDRQTAGSESKPAPVGTGPVPLEAKAVAGFKAHEWREEPPLPAVVQVQIQMACTGALWGTLAALIGGVSMVWRDLLRDDEFMAAAYPKLEEFWRRVERREPPPADALPGTSEAVRELWTPPDGQTIPLDDEAAALVAKWEKSKAQKIVAKDLEEELQNELRARLHGASFGKLSDGRYLALNTQNRSAYTVDTTSFTVLKVVTPKLPRRR